MSEIPRLRIIRPSDKSTTRFEGFLYEGNLKEVNAFWNKYKDSPKTFVQDFEQYSKEMIDLNLITYDEEYDVYYSDHFDDDVEFKMWLHDLLYKVE